MFQQNWPYYGQAGGLNTTTGQVLWNRTITSPWVTSRDGFGAYQGLAINPIHVQKLAAWNIKTGVLAWESDESDYPWGNFWAYSHAAAYDIVYHLAYDGVHAFNATNGNEVWHYSAGTDTHMETPYGTWPFYGNPVVADGKIYAGTGEHSPTSPYLRGQRLHCIDARTGEGIWSIMGYMPPTAVAEGTVFATNTYDGYVYAFAKGQTATTVSVSASQTSKGEVVGITGTVMDQSPAQPGTPAVSKESMSAWLEYLHMQQPMPTNTKGVPVTLYAMRSNGSIIDLGQVTTDAVGHFSYKWTPPDEDIYTVAARFMGDESYYSSWNLASLTVGPAPPAQPEYPEPTPAAPDYTTMYGGLIAAVVVVAVIGVANLLVLRKIKK